MAWEAIRIFNALSTDVTVVASISSFTDNNSVSHPAIFNDAVVPEWATKTLTPKTINFYRVGNIDGGLDYGDVLYTINCRADSRQDAETIQEAVYNALNRKASNEDGFFICTIIPTIGPKDSTDNNNAPVEVRIKTR